jgi:hypothetical protein
VVSLCRGQAGRSSQILGTDVATNGVTAEQHIVRPNVLGRATVLIYANTNLEFESLVGVSSLPLQ